MSWLATPIERTALMRRVQRGEGSARVFNRYAAQREQMAEDADDDRTARPSLRLRLAWRGSSSRGEDTDAQYPR